MSMGFLSDALGQLTPWSVAGSGRISNSSKLLYMSLLLASVFKGFHKTAEKTTPFSPIITLSELSVAMETRVMI